MKDHSLKTQINFDSLGGHLIKIPVTINGNIKTSFLLDTGAGVNVISDRLCEQLGRSVSGSYSGQRMTGEEITLSFSELGPLAMGEFKQEKVRVGVIDIFSKLPESLGRIDGAVSLKFFENQSFSIDYINSVIEIGTEHRNGIEVPLKIEKDHEKVMAFVEVDELGSFEVDTGNSLAVLNLDLSKKLGIDLQSDEVKVVEGKSETGFPFVSYYANISSLTLKNSSISQQKPKVAFKKLIHDGVIGNDFFKERKVIFDVSNDKMIFL